MAEFHAGLIAGTHSSVGKTTWSLALMGFFQKQGYRVQPFKVGPDYIDPGFHHAVCRPRKSRNLDRFFLSEEFLQGSFKKHSAEADLSLVEGVMGLFDGRSPLSEEGSTAQMAKLLGLPVFLVLDGSGLARSAAALVKGYQSFDPELKLAGIFVNRVGSPSHLRWLQEPIEKETGVPVLGWLPEDKGISIPERHLGLRTASEEEALSQKLERLGGLLEGRFDAGRFLEMTGFPLSKPSKKEQSSVPVNLENGPSCRIGVAYDQAFSFYYEDNFDLLREAGAELVFFSPLEDGGLPPDIDALYFGGGFPELYAGPLSRNEAMKTSVRKFHEEGGMIYSECGGLIYLAGSFTDRKGRKFPLAGLIPGNIRMTDRLQHFGYHEIDCLASTFLFPQGKKLRSHEFHYSTWEVEAGNFIQPYRAGERPEGFYDGRILASYQHLHFGSDPELARRFVEHASERRKRHALAR